jgi:hypothetical protein
MVEGKNLVIKSDGTVWGWGANTEYWSIGDGTSKERPTPVQVKFDEGNNYLRNLSVSKGQLHPAFDPDQLYYRLTVPYQTESITLTPTLSDNVAHLTVNGNAAISGYATGKIMLNVGVNLISIEIKARNGEVKKYDVEVDRSSLNYNYIVTNGNFYSA